MRRSSVFKIAGIVVVIFWLSVLTALVINTHVTPKSHPAAQTADEPQGPKASEEWMEILLKGRKVGYTVRRVTRLQEEYEITEEIFLTVTLMGSAHKVLSCTRAIVDEEFRLTPGFFLFFNNKIAKCRILLT